MYHKRCGRKRNLKKFRAGKAAGLDGASTELLRLGGSACGKQLNIVYTVGWKARGFQ